MSVPDETKPITLLATWPIERLATRRGFHDGSGHAHRKAEYTNATALALPGLKQQRQQDKQRIKSREAGASLTPVARC